MSAWERRLADLKRVVPQVDPVEALRLQQTGAVLLDVRESDEMAHGAPAGARRIGRGFLELEIEMEVPDLDTLVLTLCAGGVRSLFAAEDLRQLGYTNVRSVSGGFSEWKNAGLPVDVPRTRTGNGGSAEAADQFEKRRRSS